MTDVVIDDLLGASPIGGASFPISSGPSVEVTIGELSTWIGLSERQIARHAGEGNVIKLGRNRYDLKASIGAYCAWMRDQAGHYAPGTAGTRDGAQSGTSKGRLSEQRERLVREQADLAALKNAQLRSELVSVADVERTWTGILRGVRAAMLAVPSRVQARMAHLNLDDVNIIDREVRDALMEVSQGG